MQDAAYWKSDAGQFLWGANAYLNASKRLVGYHDWNAMQRPALHLLGHGVELLLKYPLIAGGEAIKARDYGHRLKDLWDDPSVRSIRNDLETAAVVCWNSAKASRRYAANEFAGNPVTTLHKAVRQLSRLHSGETKYALRYTIAKIEPAPNARFVGAVFRRVAKRLLDDRLSDGPAR